MARMEDWAGRMGAEWADKATTQDAFLGPPGELAMHELGPIAGRYVLDLGCGGGATTLELAGRGAHAVGIDVSPDLVGLARERLAAGAGELGQGRAEFVLADAGTHRFEGRPFDLLYSRFGAMFFDEPLAAWRKLRGSMGRGGRLAVVAWRTLADNDWARVPLQLCEEILPPAQPPAPGDPGPFAWGSPDVFSPLLCNAGWLHVRWKPEDLLLPVGVDMPGDDPVERAVAAMLRIGPLTRRLKDLPDDVKEAARARLLEGLAPYVKDDAVRLRGAIWVITGSA